MEIDYLEQNNFNIEPPKSSEDKKNEEIRERYRSIRMYIKVISMVGNLVGTILLGIVVGILVSDYTKKDIWMAISIIVFSLIAIIGFYIRVVKFK